MKFLNGLAVFGLTSLFVFYPVDNANIKQEARVEENNNRITLEVKPVAGKVNKYHGEINLERCLISGVNINKIEIWDKFNIKEEILDADGPKLRIKQSISNLGNFASFRNLNFFNSEKIEEKNEEVIETNILEDNQSAYSIANFLPDKPVNRLDKWEKDIGMDFFSISKYWFKFPVERFEKKPLEFLFNALYESKNNKIAAIKFNIEESINNYSDGDIFIEKGIFYFIGHLGIEYAKKELIEFNGYFGYLFDGEFKERDIFIRLDGNFKVYNNKFIPQDEEF